MDAALFVTHEKCAFLLTFFLGTTENISKKLGVCHCPLCVLWTYFRVSLVLV